MKRSIIISAVLLLLTSKDRAQAANFSLSQEIAGNDFFDAFYWWDKPDPTNGYVNYVDKKTAQAAGITYVDSNTGRFVMKAGQEGLSYRSTGRMSNRIHSNAKMGDGVLIAKISKAPTGCGTWPAFWTSTHLNWPLGGEIDIMEGVNGDGRNSVALHTLQGCGMPPSNDSSAIAANTTVTVDRSSYLGVSGNTDCANQPGCSVGFDNVTGSNSFGAPFNSNGGGYYAMVRDVVANGTGISVYFWPLKGDGSANVPDAVASAAKSGGAPRWLTSEETTRNWGTPQARWTAKSDSCSLARYFGDHEIIFDLTFCGDWAGQTFSSAPGCPTDTTCQAYVRDNPSAFDNARFEVDYVRIYTNASFKLAQGSFSVIFAFAAAAVVLLFA